ncbi:MAG: glucuronate isomerase [Planctomycetes bacterium]|nr:glucuronate isomerase [Planctomycetota bacterium]
MANKPFITEDFLLQNEAARRLYHDYAEQMPIIDYHTHLPSDQIARDHSWENLTQLWLSEDHYKWRIMRACGVEEKYITGGASDWERFEKWAGAVPLTLRNPIYHWTHLEMKRYFGLDNVLLSADTAKEVWETVNAKLAEPEFTCRQLMKRSKVRLVCTTDDPADSLKHHRAIAADTSFDIQVWPTYRTEKSMSVDDTAGFNTYIDKLAAAADTEINSYASYLEALRSRHDFFHKSGCRLSDHSVLTIFADDYTQSEIDTIFNKVRSGKQLEDSEVSKFRSALLYEFGIMDHASGWTQQFHLSPMRNLNTRLLATAGADAGVDSMGDIAIAAPLAKYLDRLNQTEQLPKAIIYNLNPKDNYMIATMLGNFQEGPTANKLQYGAAWWYNDQKDGIEKQLDCLSNVGLLSRTVGMLTDSRSFLSYTRHEYYRRVLCNLLGKDLEDGLLPDDLELLGKMVQDICYNNAAQYFGFKGLEKV